MLEVKNITKEYRPKKGAPVVALDNVSIKFPERGMVFILGKSGSGKSTLLNLLGGLDKYDSGEIIIKGKSSKDFTQSEFDSYRNTYLGFIFQEYNILNEFNVAQNIALALQLQGRKATNETVNEILDEVDLTGYGPRKPSELSGGQKQRVAIARALVKSPEIIMADEPTGALDSNTGLQVFDTLKKLSRDKLVIVITHDRDFAEMYGDRVIELKDGKIISDIEKYSAEATKLGEGITITDDKIISIKKGYVLTKKDLDLINSYIAEHDALISIDEKSNKDLKRFARIGDDGKKESFRSTDETKIKYSDETKFKLIKSRLPFKNSLKIGASSLKNKPVRLVFTIILSMVAFTLFGLADTMAAYNKHTATYRSIIESGQTSAVMQLTKNNDEADGNFFGGYANTAYRFTDEDVADLRSRTGLNFRPVYARNVPSIQDSMINRNGSYYYGQDFSAYLDVDDDYLSSVNFTYVGTLPQNNQEVAISKYMYSYFVKNGYKDPDDSANNVKAEDITSETVFLAKNPTLRYGETGKKLKITAIIDTKWDEVKYESLQGNDINLIDFILVNELVSTVKYGYHALLFTHPGFVDSLIATEAAESDGPIFLNKYDYGNYYYLYEYAIGKNSTTSVGGSTTTVCPLDKIPVKYNAVFFDSSKSTLNDDEILIDFNSLINAYVSWRYWEVYEEYQESELYEKYQNIQLSRYNTYDVSDEEYADYFEDLRSYLATYCSDMITLFNNTFEYNIYVSGVSKRGNVKIVGYAYTTDRSEPDYSSGYYDDTVVVLPQNQINYIKEIFSGKYSFVIAESPSNEQWKTLIKLTYADPENGTKYILQSATMETISTINDLVETLSKIFLYIGIGFAVFAALMLTNFISTSIVYKKREIGILRAVGARGSDVYGIFANESLIIALINYVLSLIATIATVIAISISFRSQYHLSVSILNFGIRQAGLMLAVSVGVALIASFLPTFRISRKRPVDAIKK